MSGGAPNPSTSIVRSAYDDVEARLAQSRPNIATLLAPFGMSAPRFEQIVLEALRANPTLLQCDPRSIVRSAYYAAEIGLELGGPLGDAYIVPFWNKKASKKEAKCIPGYRGLIHIAHEADPQIDHFDADTIYEADSYTEERGSFPVFKIVPKRFGDRGNRIGAYAICYRTGKIPQYTVMTAEEVEAIRDESLAKLHDWQVKTSPWTLHDGEMWKKTPLRRLVKLMNLRTTRARLALDLDAAEYRETREQPKTRAEDLRDKLGAVPEEIADDVQLDDEK